MIDKVRDFKKRCYNYFGWDFVVGKTVQEVIDHFCNKEGCGRPDMGYWDKEELNTIIE
jgi:hypothetical protein